MAMPFIDDILKERFAGGACELVVDHTRKRVELAIYEPKWFALSLSRRVSLKDAMIRITDYWWAKGYEEPGRC